MVKTLQLQSTFGSWGVEKVHALWREAHSEVKMRKTPQLWNTFRSWEVYKKVHGIAAWSACRKQNAKITTCSDHFWTFNSHFVCVWLAQWNLHLAKIEQKVKVLKQLQKQWQTWDVWMGPAKMYLALQAQAQDKRHLHQTCQEVREQISY